VDAAEKEGGETECNCEGIQEFSTQLKNMKASKLIAAAQANILGEEFKLPSARGK
jgi:hypothetical protein